MQSGEVEQYNCPSNNKVSGVQNIIAENNMGDKQENNLEKVVIDICHNSSLEIEPKGMKGCHRLPISRYSRDSNKRVIIKFVNRNSIFAMKQKDH